LKPDVDPEIDYHLGVAYQENHQYAKARQHFESLRGRNKKLAPIATKKIGECLIGDSLMALPVRVNVQAMGSGINTAFSELSPLISRDGNTLIFTSNRSSDEYQIKSRTNMEDVFVSSRQGASWSAPQKISTRINVKLNEAATGLSPDGRTLYLYYEDGGGDIYTSTREGDEWSTPVPLNRFINHPQYRESAATVSADGKRLFFSSNRPGGKGGFDIYVCELGANGQWGRPANLGSTVNTRRDEESPYIDPNGKTLYFSSDGHASLGDKDIFKTTLDNGKWSAPENLGYPLNTSAYEGFFSISGDHTAYFTSGRASRETSTDIYQATFASASVPGVMAEVNASPRDSRPEGITTVLKGTVIDVADATPLQATVSLVDNSSKDVVAKVSTDAAGNFRLVIPAGGNYGVTTEKHGYMFNSMNFELPPFEKYQEIDTHVLMIRAKVGSKVVLKNVFFDVNEATLKPASISELENIRELLTQNPGWRIQINGHTDNVGQREANRALSLKRAEAVVGYLIKQGISPSRLQAMGYGSERPLVSNDDEREGRQINRRTEIEIVD
jgi:outer membrane protein OmpA-like peptidoglycan-associated protein